MTVFAELSLQEVLALLEEDRPLLELLQAEGLLPAPLERRYTHEEAEQARVARVLIRQLEVNFAGVEVILHMRRQITDLQQQMLDLLRELRAARQP